MQEIIDLTVPLGPDTPLYPGDTPPSLTRVSDLAAGDAVTASDIATGAHVGTHVDLPGHFIEGGKLLGDYPAAAFMGLAMVLDLTGVDSVIGAADLPGALPEDRHLLLKTRNSAFLRAGGFREDYVHLSPAAAEMLLARSPLSIGIDYYSLDPVDTDDFPAHRLCAEAGLPVFVCLDLSGPAAGEWQFAGLPLPMPALEGAPVRAVAWR